MKKVGVIAAAAAALIGGAMIGLSPAPASATALTGFAVAAPGGTTLTEEVRHRPGHRSRRHRESRRYDRRRHGSRYSYRRPGFTYYYGGYYYANPWWLAPGVGFGVTVPMHPAPGAGLPAAHVQWCMNRYRTYDVRTDTYVPRIGVRARCSSPYVSW
jgi:hypothetical protein